MKKAILFLMFVLMLNVVNAVDTGNLTETDANFTIYMDNTGLMEFNYPGNKNVTWNATLGWAKINNGSVITTYNISPGEAWALYQDPTTCVMPYEDIAPTTNQQANFCFGSYGLHDANANGSVYFGSVNNMIINCNGATFFGNRTLNSIGIYVINRANITLKNCQVSNYYNNVKLRASKSFIEYLTIGNSTNRGISAESSSANLSITNVSFTGVERSKVGLYSELTSYPNDKIFRQNNFTVGSGSGIVVLNEGGNIIDGNVFNGTWDNTTINKAINIYGTTGAGFINISNNLILNGFKDGISVSEGQYYSLVFNNNISNVGLWGISTQSNSTKIKGNYLYKCGWNCIYYSQQNHLIDSNYIDSFYHHGIDYHGDGDVIAQNISIVNNYVTQTFSDSMCGGNGLCNLGEACMYIVGVKNSYVNNNTCINLISSRFNATNFTDDGGRGITSEVQNTSDNIISNTTFINVSGFCIRDGAWNNTYSENKFTNCGFNATGYGSIVSRPVTGDEPRNTKPNNLFLNNIFNTVLDSRIWISDFNVTANIYGSSPFGFLLQKGNQYSGANHWHSLSYNGSGTIFNISTFNNTVVLYNLTPPYNDILNSSNRVILASNQNTYSITLNPNQQIEVGDFPVVLTVLNHSILHDKFNVSITLDDSMNATLHVSTSASFTTYMNFSDSAFSTSHELQATGLSPGTLYYYQVNGTNSVGGEFNTTIYSVTTATTYCGDNIFQATNDESVTEQCDASDLNSQTCLSVGFTKGTLTCDSSCQFITTDCRIKSQMCQNNLVPLSGMATWLGLLVTIICIAFVFILFTNNSINLKLEGDAFYATILIVISVGFLLGVGILILSNLC